MTEDPDHTPTLVDCLQVILGWLQRALAGDLSPRTRHDLTRALQATEAACRLVCGRPDAGTSGYIPAAGGTDER